MRYFGENCDLSPDNQPSRSTPPQSLEGHFSGAYPMCSRKVPTTGHSGFPHPTNYQGLVLPHIRHAHDPQRHLGSSVQCWAMKLARWRTIEPASVLVPIFHANRALFIFLFLFLFLFDFAFPSSQSSHLFLSYKPILRGLASITSDKDGNHRP
jgi:hypothetical protein